MEDSPIDVVSAFQPRTFVACGFGLAVAIAVWITGHAGSEEIEGAQRRIAKLLHHVLSRGGLGVHSPFDRLGGPSRR
jgi:hypothetical protein